MKSPSVSQQDAGNSCVADDELVTWTKSEDNQIKYDLMALLVTAEQYADGSVCLARYAYYWCHLGEATKPLQVSWKLR